MPDIAIFGAGALGAALAHGLAARDRAGTIRLIDAAAAVAAGTALDIQQAAPIEGFRTRLSGGGDQAAAAGAGIIVLADAAGGGEWQEDAALALLQRLGGLAPDAAVVCAGASQRRLVERGVREVKIDRRRLIGSAPEALASAVRALVALETGAPAADVSVSVCGVPPQGTVVGWSEAAAGGAALARTLSPPQLARLVARVPHLWPPGPYTLASAAARACEAIAGASRRRCSAFVMLDGEAGARDVAVAMPLVLGAAGVQRIETPSLSGQERVALENAIEAARRV